jgi:CMP-2-keto-3-deoxyoctulosonic acid synthetase
MDVLHRYAQALVAADSKLVIVSASERIQEQLRVTGVTDLITPENIYSGDERVAATLKRAYADAMTWITSEPVGPASRERQGQLEWVSLPGAPVHGPG